MHRPCTFFAATAACALASWTSASAQGNYYEVWPDSVAASATTNATTRGTLGTAAGDVLQEWPVDMVAGVGDTGAGCQFTGALFRHQDQDAATQENYAIIVRKPDPMGMVDPTPGGILFQGPTVQTPLSAGIVAWTTTVGFTTPVTLPCDKGQFVGLYMDPAPGWSATDGHSMHMASYVDLGPPYPPVGDNPRRTARNISWNTSNGVVTNTPSGRVFAFALLTNAAVLNMGNIDPTSTRSPGGISYAAGGFFPEVKLGGARDDGLVARVRDNTNTGGSAHVLLGSGQLPFGLPLPPFSGSIWLNPAGAIVPVGSATLNAGVATITVAPPAAIPPLLGFSLWFQGVTLNSGFANPRFTNAQGVSF